MRYDNQEIRLIQKTTEEKSFLNQDVKECLGLIFYIDWFKTHNHTKQSRKSMPWARAEKPVSCFNGKDFRHHDFKFTAPNIIEFLPSSDLNGFKVLSTF